MKQWLKRRLTSRVWCGPFAGMRYLESAHGSSLLPKIAGTYELEIQPDVVDLVRAARSRIVDVGAAEGYYAVGSLRLNPSVVAVAFETSPEAREACRTLARMNQVEDRLVLHGHCDSASLEAVLSEKEVDLLVMDVEGAELDLLDPERTPALRRIPMVVELHDVFIPGLGQRLHARFAPTHHLREIHAQPRRIEDIRSPGLRRAARLSAGFADRLLNERRPEGMSWLIMIPRPA